MAGSRLGDPLSTEVLGTSVGWLAARLPASPGLDGSERGEGRVPWLRLLLWGVGITAGLRQMLLGLCSATASGLHPCGCGSHCPARRVRCGEDAAAMARLLLAPPPLGFRQHVLTGQRPCPCPVSLPLPVQQRSLHVYTLSVGSYVTWASVLPSVGRRAGGCCSWAAGGSHEVDRAAHCHCMCPAGMARATGKTSLLEETHHVCF